MYSSSFQRIEGSIERERFERGGISGEVDVVVPRTPGGERLDYRVSNKNTAAYVNRSEEASFMDIDMPLDCIGGSRANSHFSFVLGERNLEDEFDKRNIFTSLAHKRTIVSADDTEVFQETFKKLFQKADNRTYAVHIFSFFDGETIEHSFDKDVFLSLCSLKKDVEQITTVKPNELAVTLNNFRLGSEPFVHFLRRISQYRTSVREKINKFGLHVERGRVSRVVVLILSKKECALLRKDPEARELFYSFCAGAHRERIYPILCTKKLSDLPFKIVENTPLVLSYGEKNSDLLVQAAEKIGVSKPVADSFIPSKDVGVVLDRGYPSKRKLFPLAGNTREFLKIEEELSRWDEEESNKYSSFLSGLDSGDRFDEIDSSYDVVQPRKAIFTRPDKLAQEVKRFKDMRPILDFG